MNDKLTSFAPGSGCGCKIEPTVLSVILESNRSTTSFEQLLVGNHTNDDAAVWDLQNGTSLISTVDFFTPVVNDAFDFGRIAAANAISDVYAMGGKPIFANALLGWPVNDLAAELAAEVMRGARQVCDAAGIPIAGGHTVNIKEPLFGLAVNGMVNTASIKKNNSARVGDLLYLTKPIGTGIVATAIKRELADENHIRLITESMCRLNDIGTKLGAAEEVHALTDITGYALLGHLIEMTEGSGVSAELFYKQIPVFEGLEQYLSQNLIPDNTYRNWNSYEKKVSGVSDMTSFQLLNDPQTSGGLLVAVDPEFAPKMELLLMENGLGAFARPIGKLIEKTNFEVNVV